METNRRLAELLLNKVPEDGSPVGNAALREQFGQALRFAAAAGPGWRAIGHDLRPVFAGSCWKNARTPLSPLLRASASSPPLVA